MPEPLRCLIVDDETAAHYVLETYIERVDRLMLAGQCYNALDAINVLHRTPVDLLFLDINMPELTGLELLRTLLHPPKVILTTAYSEFALDSYEFGVADYLLKPIQFPRFLKAIDKVLVTRDLIADIGLSAPAPTDTLVPDSLMLRVDGDWLQVRFDELLYGQSWGNYVKLFLPDRMLLTPLTTADLTSRLPADRFLRVHKSYIVALDKINRWSGNALTIGGNEIPVGITCRRELAERLR